MAEIKVMTPEVIKCSVFVDVPVSKLLTQNLLKDMDIQLCEQGFSVRAEEQDDPDLKRDYERCSSTLKWARECKASLKSLINVPGDEKSIKLLLGFKDLNNLITFIQELKMKVTD